MTNIIVVDDDPTNAGLLKMLLELDGFAVTTCTDIEQAVAAANASTTVFVIDCHLARGANGLDLLRQIRQGETAASPQTIVIMASGDQRQEQESLSDGANQFLLKPYSTDELSAAIRKLLATGGNDGQ